MPLTYVHTDEAPQALGPYSQAIRMGNVVYCSGQIAIDPATGQLVEGGINEQTRQVLTNLTAVLVKAGLGLENVLKTTVFLSTMSDFAAMNEVYASFFGDHKPARSTVAVAALPRNALVEIECVASIEE